MRMNEEEKKKRKKESMTLFLERKKESIDRIDSYFSIDENQSRIDEKILDDIFYIIGKKCLFKSRSIDGLVVDFIKEDDRSLDEIYRKFEIGIESMNRIVKKNNSIIREKGIYKYIEK